MSAGAPGAGAAAPSADSDLAQRRAAHALRDDGRSTPHGYLARRDRGCRRRRRGVRRSPALAGVELLIAPLDADGVAGTELTDRPGVTGEIWVRAEHIRDRYDSRWLLDQAAAVHPGWHRTGDVGAVDDAGRLWVQGRTVHVISTAEGPVTPVGVERRVQDQFADPALTGSAWTSSARTGAGSTGAGSTGSVSIGAAPARAVQARAAAGTGPGVAVVGVGPVGTQQLVVVLTGPGGPLAPTARDAARAAAGRPVAAVLVRESLPVDIRHNSKIDRVEVARWASSLCRAGRPVISAPRPACRRDENPRHRCEWDDRSRGGDRAARQGRRRHRAQRRSAGLDTAKSSVTSRIPRSPAGRPPARMSYCTWPRRSTSWGRGRTTSEPMSTAPTPSSRVAWPPGCRD